MIAETCQEMCEHIHGHVCGGSTSNAHTNKIGRTVEAALYHARTREKSLCRNYPSVAGLGSVSTPPSMRYRYLPSLVCLRPSLTNILASCLLPPPLLLTLYLSSAAANTPDFHRGCFLSVLNIRHTFALSATLSRCLLLLTLSASLSRGLALTSSATSLSLPLVTSLSLGLAGTGRVGGGLLAWMLCAFALPMPSHSSEFEPVHATGFLGEGRCGGKYPVCECSKISNGEPTTKKTRTLYQRNNSVPVEPTAE